jgi:hypothetical protein
MTPPRHELLTKINAARHGPLTDAARYRCLRRLLQRHHKHIDSYMAPVKAFDLDLAGPHETTVNIELRKIYEWRLRCAHLTDVNEMIDATMQAEAEEIHAAMTHRTAEPWMERRGK